MREQKKKIRHNKQTHNRQYKDRLWRMIFNNKEDLLQLYNAINHTDYQNPDDLDIYGEKRLRLPIPKYIVFYNGTKDEPDSMELKLSDCFEATDDEKSCLECTAIMLNINYGHNQELMHQCRRLEEYAIFVRCVREYMQLEDTMEDAVSKAMDACIRQNVLTDFLKKHRAEVLEMILTTYNKKLHEKTLRREGRDEGIQNINRLNGYLLADKRYSDLERSTKDTEYQEKLLKEYGIE